MALTISHVSDPSNHRKEPVLELTQEDLAYLIDNLKNGFSMDGKNFTPIESVAFFITKHGKQKLLIDLKVKNSNPAEYVGIDGGGGSPPRFPVN